ncbi:MAG: LysE family translocator [Tannerellaceae bacterium]|jgi:threonine/homoserine/homoserine lactone efflux protein|nr:LysE family translocator [Tannerellaceae bacterium]
MLELIIKGLVIGILVSAPMGPVGMLCVQRTLSKGRWHGFCTGVGAMLSDIIYAGITCLGLGFVVSFIEANHFCLQLIGSIVLGIFGLYMFKYNPVSRLKTQREKKLSYTSDFVTGFLLTLSNALVVFLFIGLFAHFNFIDPDYSVWMILSGLLCIGLGAVGWWFVVTYVLFKIKEWFNIRDAWMLNRIAGALIILISIGGIILLFIH